MVRRLDAASRHQQQDDGIVQAVAHPGIKCRLAQIWIVGAGVVELAVDFQPLKRVAHDHAGEPAAGSVMHEVVAELNVRIQRTELAGKFKRQQERLAGGSDAALHRVVGIVDEPLREGRDREALLAGIVEAPLDAEIRLPQPILCLTARVGNAQPRVFVGELDALADAIVEVKVGRVAYGIVAVEQRNVADIDLPVVGAGSAGIVGEVRRASLANAQPATAR